MPNKSMPAYPRPTPGALLIGDAFNMRHPLTGGGVTVALSDVVVLRDLLRPLADLNDAALLCKYLESFYSLRKVIIIHLLDFMYLKYKLVHIDCCSYTSNNAGLKIIVAWEVIIVETSITV